MLPCCIRNSLDDPSVTCQYNNKTWYFWTRCQGSTSNTTHTTDNHIFNFWSQCLVQNHSSPTSTLEHHPNLLETTTRNIQTFLLTSLSSIVHITSAPLDPLVLKMPLASGINHPWTTNPCATPSMLHGLASCLAFLPMTLSITKLNFKAVIQWTAAIKSKHFQALSNSTHI